MQAMKYKSCLECFQRKEMVFFHLNITIRYTLVFLRTFMYVDHITIILTWELGGFAYSGQPTGSDCIFAEISVGTGRSFAW